MKVIVQNGLINPLVNLVDNLLVLSRERVFGNEPEADSLKGSHRGWFFSGSFPHSLVRTSKTKRTFSLG